MAQAVDIEIVAWGRNPHFFKEQVTHVGIEVLSRVYDGFMDIGMFTDFSADHGCFHELRSCPDNGDNVHKMDIMV